MDVFSFLWLSQRNSNFECGQGESNSHLVLGKDASYH